MHDVVRFLPKCGSNVEARDSEGQTPLHAATLGGHLDTVKLLLESGADINVRNSNDESPLDLASVNGMLEVAIFLADQMGVSLPGNASQNKPPDGDDTPPEGLSDVEGDGSVDGDTDSEEEKTLHIASERGDLDFVRVLLDGR